MTILPRGESGGHTSFIQDKDRDFITRTQVIARLDVLMGGRVGEEMILGQDRVTAGASSDFKVSPFRYSSIFKFKSALNKRAWQSSCRQVISVLNSFTTEWHLYLSKSE